jgi:voltage-gated potassium channel
VFLSKLPRHTQAAIRDSWLLFLQFRWPLIAFNLAIIGGGILYYYLSIIAGEPIDSLVEAIYQALSLTFLQSIEAFPDAWYLVLFYFVMPVIGIGILAQGVADFGYMFFNRRARHKEWEMTVASIMTNHIILIGLGHLGYRVVRSLAELEQDIVVIELDPSADLIENAQRLGVPVIQDDATRQAALLAAGVERARSIILCTQNDSLNLQIAVKSRSYNPDIHVVIRIFDDDFAEALHQQFGFTAISATSMAAPAFASAAAEVEITRPITVEGQLLSLARLQIKQNNRLIGLRVGQVEENYNVSLVLLRREEQMEMHPSQDRELRGGDTIAVLGGTQELSSLINDSSLPNLR